MRPVIFIFFCLGFPACFAQDFDVITYNIRYDNPGDGVNQWSSRKAKVFELIRKHDPDILGVQEALHHQLTDITSDLQQYKFVGVGRDDGKTKGEYSAIFYKHERFEILENNTFWLSETPEVPGSKSWDAAITRVATWAKMRDKESGATFLIVNTHFDHIGKTARKNSAALIKAKIAELRQNLPLILMGDFNFTRDQEPYATVMNPEKLTLIDSAPANSHGTACGFSIQGKCNGIDYVFFTPEWTVKKYLVITDHDGAYYPSDHLPVAVTLVNKNLVYPK